MNESELEYAGFWIRVLATIIDTLLILMITLPLLVSIYGWKYFSYEKVVAGPADFLVSWVLPAVAVILFWVKRQATPGKQVLSLRVLDAETGASLSGMQSLGRYLAYFVSLIPFGLGLLWIAFDNRHQGWHDKLANSVVVRAKNRGPKPVRFHQT
ncbi:RDD family protein [Rhodoferax sp.]|uniref:RDD family protein n=1 Tax=Rhodoferax sp. TaxID=50421 RepID=UPI00283E29E4|nr:RDD family protein [Rhodoferax sp.]MDR3371451.1 RDD family protein [Rhodoferax sp.]